MLRTDSSPRVRGAALALLFVAGALAALLVILGNPGNMGICGACFLRDTAGALGLSTGKGPACFRPEVAGVILGALVLALATGRYTARSGSHAVTRLVMGIWMAIAALVFLGCPFRLLQRLGGGDLNAWLALPGFLAGVFIALQLEGRGYHLGKTQPSPVPLGFLGPLAAGAILALYLSGLLLGPGPDATRPGSPGGVPPPRAPWVAALLITLAAGAALSATGFCAITSARQVFQRGKKAMLIAALVLMAGFAVTTLAAGRFHGGFADQPAAHGDLLWNALGLLLLGLTGAFAGGCPVRQMVMAGEGNGDAFVTVTGILLGGAIAHNLGLVSAAATATSAGGATPAGRVAVGIGIAFAIVYAVLIARASKRTPPAE